MERHVKVYRAHRALSWLYALLAALFMLLVISTPGALGEPSFLVILSVFGGFFLAHYLTAKGAREARPWARTSSILISILLLFAFPLGTIIAAYLLLNTWREWDTAPSPSVFVA